MTDCYRGVLMLYKLLRHTPDLYATTADYAAKLQTVTVTGHPPIPDIPAALKRRLHDKLTDSGAPIAWWPGEAWCVVTDLHRDGHHTDATALAELLRWCDQQGGDGAWEIRRPAEEV